MLDGMEVDRPQSSTPWGVPPMGGFGGGFGILSGVPFGAPPMPSGMGGSLQPSPFGALSAPLASAHDAFGNCRHGQCNCFCECSCACVCIKRTQIACRCVPIEARAGEGGSSGSTAPAPGSSSCGSSAPFAGASPPGQSLFPGLGSAPLNSSAGVDASPRALPSLGQPIFGDLFSGTTKSSSEQPPSRSRKRQSSEYTPSPFSLSTPSVFGQPAQKKCVLQTMDRGGNCRPYAVDAAEVMVD